MSTTEEVDQAVNVATEAARDWGRTPSPKRAQVMFRFKRLLEENRLRKIENNPMNDCLTNFQNILKIV